MHNDDLSAKLESIQRRARVRTMDEATMMREATIIRTWLSGDSVPVGTTVRSNFARVANCYRGTPEATYVIGAKAETGTTIDVRRDAGGFGARSWTVNVPQSHILRGCHGGAIDDLSRAVIEAREPAVAATP